MEVVVVNGKLYSFTNTQDPEVIYIDSKDLKSQLYDGITIGRLKKYLKCDSYEDALKLLRHMFRYYISVNNIVLASAVFKYAYFMHIRVYEGYRLGLKPMMELFDRLKFCHSGSGKYNGHHRYNINEWTLYLEKSGKKSTHSQERMMHEATAEKIVEYMKSMDLDLGDATSTTVYSCTSAIGKFTDYHVFKEYGHLVDDEGINELEIPDLEIELGTSTTDEGIDELEIPELGDVDVYEGIDEYEIPELE